MSYQKGSRRIPHVGSCPLNRSPIQLSSSNAATLFGGSRILVPAPNFLKLLSKCGTLQANVHLPVMRGTQTGDVLNRVTSSLSQRDNVMDFSIGLPFNGIKARACTGVDFTLMSGPLPGDCDHERIA